MKKNSKVKKLELTVGQRHVHADERGPGKHPEGRGCERKREVGGDHRGVADEQDPGKRFLNFYESFFFFFEFFLLFRTSFFSRSLCQNLSFSLALLSLLSYLFLSLSDLLALSPAGAARAACTTIMREVKSGSCVLGRTCLARSVMNEASKRAK